MATWEWYLRQRFNEPDQPDIQLYAFARIAYRIYVIQAMLGGTPKGEELLTEDKFLVRFVYETKVGEGRKAEASFDEQGNPVIDHEEVKQVEKLLFGIVGLDRDGKAKAKNPRIKTVTPRPDPSKRPSRAKMTRGKGAV